MRETSGTISRQCYDSRAIWPRVPRLGFVSFVEAERIAYEA